MNPGKDTSDHDQYNILRAVFDQSVQFIGLMTLDGKLIDANRTAIKFAGAKEEDVIGKFFWETPWWIHSKELQEKLKEATKKAGQGEAVRFEATHPGPDGKLHNIDFSLKPVRDEKDKVIYLIPEGRDITEIKKIEEELRESEEKCKSLFDNAKDGILVADAETEKFKMANKTICKMLGYTNEEIVTLGVENIHPQESLSLIKEKFGQMIRGEIQNAPDLPVKRKDGSIFYADITVSPSLISGKKYFAGFFRDATERRKAEESTKRFELLYQSSADAVMTIEPPEWKFTSGNPAALKMYNVKNEQEFAKLGPWDLSPEKQPDGSLSSVKAREMIDRAMKDGSSYFEWTHKKYKGEDFPTTVLLSKVKMGDKEFLQAVVRDISEVKKAEKALNEKMLEADRLNKITIGRELKMVELKKEVARLKGEKQ